MFKEEVPTRFPSRQDGNYPRPQLMRKGWADLCGPWNFVFDDADEGVRQQWWSNFPTYNRLIEVPFPFESPKSGIDDQGFHPIIWYSRTISAKEIASAGFMEGKRLLVHFGAVDYSCDMWVNGHCLKHNEGGHVPFTVDITSVADLNSEVTLVVRVEDDPADVEKPRGKQDWHLEPHSIWYKRTSGIWQPVWIESVPSLYVDSVQWYTDLPGGRVSASIVLSGVPDEVIDVSVDLLLEGTTVGFAAVKSRNRTITISLDIAQLQNGQAQQEVLWCPENPVLFDAIITAGKDEVTSYFGIRTVEAKDGVFKLNGLPYYIRAVLSQGYWPESCLAAPTNEALRNEVELIKQLGFNSARVHQKYEDPKLLYWADKLGVIIWEEAPSCFAFSSDSVVRTISEWTRIIERDFSHPSVCVWVPLNESWGVQQIASSREMQKFAEGMVAITKTLDNTRVVSSNDGWEQVNTDLVGIHDYDEDHDSIRSKYETRKSVLKLIEGVGPAGRRLVLRGDYHDLPFMLTEFGGISLLDTGQDDSWGYSNANSRNELEQRLGTLFEAVNAGSGIAGFCYTQLTDTEQEKNGLLDEFRNPKLPFNTLRRIVKGEK